MAKASRLEGKVFHSLTVLKEDGRIPCGHKLWLCQCKCGNTTKVTTGELTSGGTKSCGCARKEAGKRRQKDLTNQKFGRLLVIKEHERRNGKTYIWECVCDCGNTTYSSTGNLQSGGSTSCGCYTKERTSETSKLDILGITFNRLTPVEYMETKDGNRMYNCKCSCGNTTVVAATHLKSGHIKSCGCLLEEISNSPKVNLVGQTIRNKKIIDWKRIEGKRGIYYVCVDIKTGKEYIHKSDYLLRSRTNVGILLDDIRTAIKNAFRLTSSKKNKTIDMLGCSVQEFIEYIGPRPKDCELDHICPCNQAQNEEELIKLQHFSNFRWLPKLKNIIKSDNWTVEGEELCKKLLGREWKR